MKERETKLHYKMYKAGKQWMFAAVATAIMGTATTVITTHAEVNEQQADSNNSKVSDSKDVNNDATSNHDNTSDKIETAQQVQLSSNDTKQITEGPIKSDANQAPVVSNDKPNNENPVTDDNQSKTGITNNSENKVSSANASDSTDISTSNSLEEQGIDPVNNENVRRQNQAVTTSQTMGSSPADTNNKSENSNSNTVETNLSQETDVTPNENNADLPNDTLNSTVANNLGIADTEVSAEDQRNKMVNFAIAEQNVADTLTGTWGTVNWTYDDTDNKLSLNTAGTLGMRAEDGSPFNNQQITQNVKEVDVNAPIKLPTDSSNLFTLLPNLAKINGLDKIDTSEVTTMESMFFNNPKLETLDLSTWDTSKVTNMARIFQSCGSLSSLNISGEFAQNTGKVTDMSYMFCGLFTSGSPYDAPDIPKIGLTKITGLEQLDTHSVTDMSFMFNGDQLLAELDVSNFNTEHVTNMDSMFRYVYVPDLELNNFNTENVTNMKQMFNNSNLLNSLDLSSFNTRNVTDMSGMFKGTVVLTYDNNQNIVSFGLWQLILGKDTVLNNTVGLSDILTGTVITPTINLPASGQWQELGTGTLPAAPYTTESNNYTPNGQRLKASGLMDGQSHPGTWVWSVDSIEISGNATDTWNPNSDLAQNWNPEDEVKSLTNADGSQITSKAEIKQAIANGTLTVQYEDINGNTVSEDSLKTTPGKYNVIYKWYGNPNYAYNGQKWFFKSFTCTVDVNDNIERGVWGSATWIFDKISGTLTFDNGGSLRSVNGGTWGELPLAPGSVKHVDFATKVETDIYAQGLFRGVDGNKQPSWFSNVVSFEHMENLDTSKSINMADMFGDEHILTNLDLSNFNTSQVTNMTGMFARCDALNDIKGFKNLDTSQVTDMSNLFIGDNSLTYLDITGMNTSKLINMDSTFANIPNLKQIVGLNTWDTSQVTSMKNLFWNDQSLTDLDVSNFNTAKVTDMSGMFNNDTSLLSLDLSNFNTGQVTTMNAMFYHDSVLTAIDGLNNHNFNTENVTDMDSMFANDSALVSVDVSGFKTPKVTTIHNLFLFDNKLKSLTFGSGWTNDSLTDARAAFYGDSALTILDLSNFKLPKTVTQMWAMFNGTSNVKTLDLSGFDTRGISNPDNSASNMQNLFTGSGINKLILGENTILNNADLPSANPSEYPVDSQGNRIGTYTGFDWQLVGDGTDTDPAGIKLSNTALMDGKSHTGTWVWEQTTKKARVAEIKYVDEQGNEISGYPADYLDVWPGASIHMRAVPANIPNYTLDDSKLPNNTDIQINNAQLNAPIQLITYVYRANTEDVHEEAIGTETVSYEVADGVQAPTNAEHTAHFTRDGIKNLVTGEIKWEDWKSDDASYAIKSPAVKNQTPDKAEVQGTLTPNESHTDKVVYSANTENVHEDAIGIEEVEYLFANDEKVPGWEKYFNLFKKNESKNVIYTAKFTRDGIKNLVTGEIKWEDWKSDNASYAIKSPAVKNQTPDQAEVQGTLVPGEHHKDVVVYRADMEDVHEEAIGTETVSYEVSGGAQAPTNAEHTAHFTRDGIKNMVTGEIKWEDWKSDDASYDINSPAVKNQTPDKAEVQGTLTPNESHTDKVVYSANTENVHEDAIGTEEVEYLFANDEKVPGWEKHFNLFKKNESKNVIYTAKFTRDGIKNLVTGEIKWEDWHSDNASYAIKSPKVKNQTPDQAEVQGTLVPGERHKDVVVYRADMEDVHEEAIGTETVSYEVSGGAQAPTNAEHTAHFTRDGIKNLVTGEIKWEDWKSDDANYDIKSPEVKNQTPDKAEVQGTLVPEEHHKDVVVYHADMEDVHEEAIGTETVSYEVADGAQAPATQHIDATFTRHGIKNLVTGEIKWEDWHSDDANYDIKSPEVLNQTPDKVEVQGTLTPNESHADKVVYSANTQAVTDKASATENVTYEVADGSQAPATQHIDATFTRHGIKNLVTGEIKWEDWHSDNASYDIKSPAIKNQTPDKSEVQGTLTPNESHTDKVVYSANTQAVTDKASATESVTYEVADGAQAPANAEHTAHFTRDGIKNLVTGEIKWEDWKSDDASYDIKSPAVKNQTPDQVEVQGTLVPGEHHKDVVVYRADMEDVHEEAIGTETVSYEVSGGAQAPTNAEHTAHFTRDGIKNLVTGEIKWEDWKSDDASYAIKSPEVLNQTPDKAEVQGTLTPGESHADKVVYSANTTTSTEYTTGRLTINYVDKQGNQVAPVSVQSSGFTRTITKDAVTGKTIETGSWTAVNNVDYSVISPTLANRTVDQVKVSGTLVPGEDQMVTVIYTDNVESVIEHGTGSITIEYVDTNNHQVASSKNLVVPFTRVGTKDLVTGQINWNPWKADSDVNYQIVSPTITGMTTNQENVSGQVQVNQNDVKQVVYTNVPVVPVQPVTPSKPSVPAQPATPSIPDTPTQPVYPETPSIPVKPAQPETPAKAEQPVVAPATPVQPSTKGETPASTKPAETPKQNALPQTGQDATPSLMSMIGMVLLSIFGFFGIGGLRKKKEDQ